MADIGIRVVVLGVAEARRGVSTVQNDLNRLESTMRGLSGTASTVGKTMSQVGSAISGLGRTLTLTVTGPIAVFTASLINAGIEFQSAFAGVTKTIDDLATPMGELTAEGKKLRDEFIALSTTIPVHPNALAALGQLSGQFGETKETVIDMVKVLAMLRETTDLVGESQQQAFAQIARITKLAADEYDNFASVLVFLGNNFPTTEAKIVSFTERIAGTATAMGISLDAILAWGAAVTASGIQAETGATAIRKALMEMSLAVSKGGDELKIFADTATQAFENSGLSAEEFANKFGIVKSVLDDGKISSEEFAQIFTENASGALEIFINALEGMSSTQQISVLDSLGLAAQRVGSTLQNLAQNADLVHEALGGAGKAFEEGVALQEEFNKRTNTLKADLQILQNQFVALGIKVFNVVEGDLRKFVDSLGNILDWITALSPETVKWGLTIAGIAGAVGPALVVIGGLISVLGTVATALAAIITPAGLAIAAISAIGAAILAAFGPEILGVIQSVIDKLSEISFNEIMIDLGFNIERAPDTSQIPELSGEGPTAGETNQRWVDDMRGQSLPEPIAPLPIAPVVDDLRQVELAISPLERVSEILNKLLPPEIVGKLATFAGVIGSVAVVAMEAGSAFAAVVAEIVRPELTEAIDELNGLMSDMGITWTDVFLGIATVVGGVILIVLSLLVGLVQGAVSAFDAIIETIRNLNRTFEMIRSGFNTFFSGFIELMTGVAQFFTGIIEVMLGIVTGDTERIRNAFAMMGDGIKNVLDGIVLMFYGLVQVITGAVLSIITVFMGGLNILVSFTGGFLEGFLGLWNRFFESMTGKTNETMNAILEFIMGWKDKTSEVFNSLVSEVIGFFEYLYQKLIGGSIVPEMTSGIIASITGMKDKFLQMIGDLVNGAISKFSELATKAKEVLGDIFGGGGGESAGGSITLDIDEESIIAIQTALEGLNASLLLLQTQFMNTGLSWQTFFITPILTSSILLNEQLFSMWTILVAQFSITIATLVSEWSDGVATMQTDWVMASDAMLSASTSFNTRMLAMMTSLRNIFITTTQTIQDSLIIWRGEFQDTYRVFEQAGLLIKYIMFEIANVTDGLANAFQRLGDEAALAAARVCAAYAAMADCAAKAGSDMQGSPELKIQHPFERFEKYLKSTPFDFSMDTRPLQSVMAMMSAVSVPGNNINTSTRTSSVNIGDIYGANIDDKESLTELLEAKLIYSGLLG